MHHWDIGGPISIGWPDQHIAARTYNIVEWESLGKVFRCRVTNGTRQGAFLVIYDCPDVVLEQLAEQATPATGFPVIVSSLHCSVDGMSPSRYHNGRITAGIPTEVPGRLTVK